MYNTKHIQIAKGLKEGERVLLSPPFDLQEKDLEGAVLAEDEKAKAAKTNVPPRLVLSEDDQDKEERPNGTAPGAEQSQNGALAGEGRGRGGGFNPAEMLKQYDKNADGQLDESEREALKKDMAGRFGRPGGANGALPNPADFLKQFDKDGDGQLSETERTAMRDAFGGGRSGLPSGRGEASEGAPRSPQGERPVRPEGGRGGGGRAP
jgi:hypothetical protein